VDAFDQRPGSSEEAAQLQRGRPAAIHVGRGALISDHRLSASAVTPPAAPTEAAAATASPELRETRSHELREAKSQSFGWEGMSKLRSCSRSCAVEWMHVCRALRQVYRSLSAGAMVLELAAPRMQLMHVGRGSGAFDQRPSSFFEVATGGASGVCVAGTGTICAGVCACATRAAATLTGFMLRVDGGIGRDPCKAALSRHEVLALLIFCVESKQA